MYNDDFDFPIKKIESGIGFIYRVRGGNNYVYFLKAFTANYGIYVNICGTSKSDCKTPTHKNHDKKA